MTKTSLVLWYLFFLSLIFALSSIVKQSINCTQCDSVSVYKIGQEKFCLDHFHKAELKEQNAEQMVNGSIRRSIYSY